jgi:spoIIIJ-associated protein
MKKTNHRLLKIFKINNMDSKNLEIIKNAVQELIEKAGYSPQIEVTQSSEEDQESIICNVNVVEDSHILIGQYGVNLAALQHIARLIVRKKTDEKVKFVLDVNSYRQEKNQSIADLASEAAQQAIREGRAIVMRPMSAYERRLVHMELANKGDVVTESIGEGEGRKVVVKPAKQI